MKICWLTPLALAVLAAVPLPAEGQHVPKLSVQNHQAEIRQLMALSAATAKKEAIGDVDAKAIAAKCADELVRARSYGSFAAIFDRENEQLRSHNALGQSMTFDHVHPDRYHFIRDSWGGGPGYDFDEWVTIGDSDYVFTSIWMEGIEKVLSPAGHDARRENRGWGLPKYIGFLRRETPTSTDLYLYDGKPYYLLVYEFPASQHPEFPEYVGSGSVDLKLWIDAKTGLLAQADLVSATDNPGKAPRREFQQVFVAYSGDVRVEPPSELCSKKHPSMCFALIALSPAAGADLAE